MKYSSTTRLVNKEIWEMTHKEYMFSAFPKLKPENVGPSVFRPTRVTHRFFVEKALLEGEAVPIKVMEDYPDLDIE